MSKSVEILPTSHGGSVGSRINERVGAQQAFEADPKFKKYVQQVEKCLNSFDNVHEWADCIAFLKQLLKTFQSYMQFKEIPRKLIVAKRLAQCLNPGLPAGVHQRALDVYAHILAVQGSDGLLRDLALWSSGLFPFFEYASTSVKPALLNLYDTHYLPLQGGLRPVMKSFILALLPGLEEETGEFFEKVLSLLDRLSGTVSPSFFLQNVWLVMMTSPSSRGTSINFLSRRLPKLKPSEDITSIVGRDIGLMIRAFSAALEDDNLLVRRGALDLLILSLRIDSVAVKSAQAEDRTVLMRSATGVVLRRDLSLNRRLYSWLLGPEENSDHQISHLREHALELLRLTLKDEMFSPSLDYAESRPFKIFISLLDKWEVGFPLTEVLVYDAFCAIKKLLDARTAGRDDIKLTASTLYEAVEPHAIWKQIGRAIFAEIIGDGLHFEATRLAIFILKTFSSGDEEIQSVHLPVLFSAVVDLLNFHISVEPSKAALICTREVLRLLEEILHCMPESMSMERPELTGDSQTTGSSQRPYLFACTFYGLPPALEIPSQEGPFNIPYSTIFSNLVELNTTFFRDSVRNSSLSQIRRETLLQSVTLIDKFVVRVSTSTTVRWNPKEWVSLALEIISHELSTFMTVDRIITLLIALHRKRELKPTLNIDDRHTMQEIIGKLLQYLNPEFSVYHARVVSLIWLLDSEARHPHVESILAKSMTSLGSLSQRFEAFGVLWRLTDDNLIPGFRLKVPMMIVLETLNSEDPNLRRIGETWMRCNIRSYLRVLDPILFELTDPSIIRTTTITTINGRELQGLVYERPFNLRYVNHVLDILLLVVRSGGQSLTKTAHTTSFRRSLHSGFISRISKAGFVDTDTNYLDILVDLLLRFLESEPKGTGTVSMQPANTKTHSATLDILQAIVTRGELEAVAVGSVEAVVVRRLFISVHTRHLDLQNKLLHLLHSLISAQTQNSMEQIAKPPPPKTPVTSPGDEAPPVLEPEDCTYSVNPLLVQTLIDALTSPDNRPVLQHWLDFILMAIPQFQPALHSLITPLNECLCRQLATEVDDLMGAATKDEGVANTLSTVNDADFVMLLNGLERFISLSLSTHPELGQAEDEASPVEKSSSETVGLLGYVSGVFASENVPSVLEDYSAARFSGNHSLREGVRVLFSIWDKLRWSKPEIWSPKEESLSLIYSRTRLRCRRVFEQLFRSQSTDVFESIIDCWNQESGGDGETTFELIDVLVSSSQNAVHMICESISCRMPGFSEKTKKHTINFNLSESVLFLFLEHYLSRLEGPIASRVWGRFLQLAKEVITTLRESRTQGFAALRCLTVLAEKLIQTPAMDDRRIRKELQETYGKLLDGCVLYVGRSLEQPSWIRRSTKDAISSNGTESLVLQSELKVDDNLNSSSTPLPNTPRLGPASTTGNSDLVYQIMQFVASSVLPNVRTFLFDSDRILTACTNITYYIVTPSLKGKSKPLEVDVVIVDVLKEMVKITSALKAWRTPLAEVFNDNRLFNSNAVTAVNWKPIFRSLIDADKSAFPELLAKVATAPSANIFANKEYEMLQRSLNLRRLSFIILAGEKNHFVAQLPSIQEKLVDVLRNITSPIVQSEVYLCVRVLLCRLSAHNLTSFWPVILTELYRVFDQVLSSLPPDGSEDLQLVLAASKCLDLLLVLQTQEFQVYQWMFVTDTVDAVYRPDNWVPEAMMDQLAEVANSLPIGESKVTTTPPSAPPTDSSSSKRKPLLASLRSIESIRDLIPFFSHVSIASYEAVYGSGGSVDWQAIENGLMDDLFDG